MAVAWVGNREASPERAAEHAAGLLEASRCPVFSLDVDVEGTRAAIALAQRVGAACDHMDGAALAGEIALFTDHGGFFVAPGEARRRADLVVLVGDPPPACRDFVADLLAAEADLGGGGKARAVFAIAGGRGAPWANAQMRLGGAGDSLAATLASVRAQCAGRPVAKQAANFERFAEALSQARYAVFLCSGASADPLALEMLQGLVADINRKSRASVLLLPASEAGWGGALASTWMTGFPLRTGFARGFSDYDPWRFDVSRMIEDGEADLHLRIAPTLQKAPGGTPELVALAKTTRPIAGAAVTIAVGEPGVDHDAVMFSARTGTFVARNATSQSDLPAATVVLRSIAAKLAEAPAPC